MPYAATTMAGHPGRRPAGSVPRPMIDVPDEDRQWLFAAVDLSRLSPPTPTNYAVGAVIADGRGGVLSTGYTGEIGSREHAEEVALAKLAAQPGRDLDQVTLYSTLEPCTTRRSRTVTCTDLILAAGIKRVVIALREPLLFADCHGVETLRAGGVEVVEITDMGPLVREVNAHVLDLRAADNIR
jgi:diaminohydroxyphosphoribosylaminopyrimidine deaminase/5-amino-6-(5-phosphoribosylamino)uracil reductase